MDVCGRTVVSRVIYQFELLAEFRANLVNLSQLGHRFPSKYRHIGGTKRTTTVKSRQRCFALKYFDETLPDTCDKFSNTKWLSYFLFHFLFISFPSYLKAHRIYQPSLQRIHPIRRLTSSKRSPNNRPAFTRKKT